jgi:hypothetical protein
MITERISSLTLEQVQAAVQADSNGLPYVPTSAAVAFAFLESRLADPVSGDWKTGSWDVTRIGTYVAQCKVGPGGAATLAVGEYYVWLRITDTTAGETPIEPIGKLIVS